MSTLRMHSLFHMDKKIPPLYSVVFSGSQVNAHFKLFIFERADWWFIELLISHWSTSHYSFGPFPRTELDGL